MVEEVTSSDNRRSDRVAANFAVSFRELGEEEASRLAGIEPVAELPVPSPVPLSHAGPKVVGPVPGRTENLSQGGLSMTGDLQLLGDRRLERGKKILVEFALPGEREAVKAVAVVAWTLEGKGEHSKFTAGLMFLGINSADLEKIGRYMEGHNAI